MDFGEQFSHYSQVHYNHKLEQLDLMPLNMKMKFTDLLLFYKIINDMSPIKVPQYLQKTDITQLSSSRASTKIIIANDTLRYTCTLRPTPRNLYLLTVTFIVRTLPGITYHCMSDHARHIKNIRHPLKSTFGIHSLKELNKWIP